MSPKTKLLLNVQVNEQEECTYIFITYFGSLEQNDAKNVNVNILQNGIICRTCRKLGLKNKKEGNTEFITMLNIVNAYYIKK